MVMGRHCGGITAIGWLATATLHVQAPVAVRQWTMQDILTAPVVTDILRSGDGSAALYVTRAADPAKDTVMSDLWSLNLKTGQRRRLLHAPVIEELRRIPGTAGVSVLADLGLGVQLYRLDRGGRTTAEVVNRAPLKVGAADGSAKIIGMHEPPRKVGILSYSRSPDGKWLWYCLLRQAAARPSPLHGEQIAGLMGRYRPRVDAIIDYHLRSATGGDRLVASRPVSDRAASLFGGNVSWRSGAVQYVREDVAPVGPATVRMVRVVLADGRPKMIGEVPADPFRTTVKGPAGGQLVTNGFGSGRRLIEKLADGRTIDRGSADFLIGDPRTAGQWLSADGKSALIGTRLLSHPRYGLEWLDREQRRRINTAESLTACDFAADLSEGVCVREGQTLAPEIIRINPRSGTITAIAPVSPNHSAITPLRVTPRDWTNRLGYAASGFIVWPRNYQASRRYPTIIVTHGSDADERFARTSMQWNYPIQLWAEQGYVVLLVNDPARNQSAELDAANDQLDARSGTLTPAQLRDRLWLNGVYTFDAALDELDKAGVVDANRVGIAGYSRGSQMANVAMTQSTRFRAASSGDGDYLEPSGYMLSKGAWDVIFGGSPFGTSIDNYRLLSPSLRAEHVHGAVLQQLAAPLFGAMEYFRGLRGAGVPADITLYRGETAHSDETHVFHVPSNRRMAMNENMAWFDFWLLGRRTAGLVTPARYDAWTAMAKAYSERSRRLSK